MELKEFKSCSFKIENSKLKKSEVYSLCYIENNQPKFILLKNKDTLKKILSLKEFFGKSKYHFRKGIGITGGIHRLFFKEKKDGYVEFYPYKKDGRFFKVNTDSILKVPYRELKYIYPFILSPNIKEKGLDWNKTYVIFPYEYGEKQPIDEYSFRQEAPTLFNYLKSHKSLLENESSYNKRIQNKKYFYGVIRVGEYTYSNYFVIMRDNTRVVAQVATKIKTDWDEIKIPIFDNHISYLSRDLENKPISLEKAEKIRDILNNPLIKELLEGYYDSRSIGSRLPIKIEELEKKLELLEKDKK